MRAQIIPFGCGADGLASRRLSGVSAATGVPQRALAVETLLGLALLTAFRLAGTSALNVFFYLATIGVLSLIPDQEPEPYQTIPLDSVEA